MTLLVFKYCLPLAVGYIVFASLSRRLRPWSIPPEPSHRPVWFLGLWQAGVIAVALGTLSDLAAERTLYEVLADLRPLIGTVLLTMLTGCILALAYRERVSSALQRERHIIDIGETRALTEAESISEASPLERLEGADVFEGIDGIDGIDQAEALALLSADHEIQTDEAQIVADLRDELQSETLLRVETEKHLRITRKALHGLESQARDHEAARTDAMIGLEEELESQVRLGASAESRLQHELEKVMTLEIAIVDMKHELLESRRDQRKGMQARAKAMATAHKALAHARQSLQVRTRLEARIGELDATLANRQLTITSLVKALEQEKGRSDAQIDERVRQVVMHQRQLQARRAVEEMATVGAGKSGSRLVKRIAKARRIEGSAN